jgi:hypothetical protein
MKLSVKNAKDYTLTSLLKKATKFYASVLLGENFNSLEIFIAIEPGILSAAYCINNENNNFYIEIAKFKKITTMLRVLAHEMVHVKQYFNKELMEIENNTYWCGKKYEKMSYWDHPWEIEAYGLENSLVAKFIHKFDLYKQLKERKSDWCMD